GPLPAALVGGASAWPPLGQHRGLRYARRMSLRAVTEHLSRFGKEADILEFTESSATVTLAAEKVGTEPARIAKTLAFYDPSDPARAILIVAAGDARLHNGSFKRLFGGKAKMVA